MKVVLIFRKRNPIFFSIERVFGIILSPMEALTDIKSIRLPFNGIHARNILHLWKFKNRSGKQTLFHVTGDVHYTVFAFPRKRTLLTIHDCVFMENHSGFKKWLIKKLLLDWPLMHVKYVTTISEKTKNEIIRLTSYPANRIHVIPNPVSPEIYFSDRPFNRQKPRLLFLGSTTNKNLDRVIPALKGISCLLHIVGKPTPAQLTELNASGIDHVIEQGITDQELADRYAASDIILFPTLYEGFGLPIIEGFKAGRAVLTSNLDPMKQVAAEAACLVDPFDISSIHEGLLKLIDDDQYRAQLIQKGFGVVKNYSPEHIAEQYFHLYKKVYKDSYDELTEPALNKST